MTKPAFMKWRGTLSIALACFFAVTLPALGFQAGAGVGQEPPVQAATPPVFNPESWPQIVARVDGTEVTRAELINEARGALVQLAQMGVRRDADAQFYREALDQILAGILLSQEAGALGVAATSDEVASRIAALKAGQQTAGEFEQMVAREGVSMAEFERDLERSITIEKFIANQIAANVSVTEEAQRTFYDQNLERMQRPEMAKVRHILIQVAAEATAEQKQGAGQKAEDLLQRINAGEDFAALAREYSQDPSSKESGGELPPFARGQTLPAFDEAAFALKPGERSGVVETPVGFHIIEMTDFQAAGTAGFEEVQPRIHQVLKNQAVQAQMRARVEELRLKAKIEIFI